MFVNNTEVDVITRKAIEFISKIENCSHAKSLQAPERIKPRPWRSTASAPWLLTTNNSAARARQVQASARRLPRSIQVLQRAPVRLCLCGLVRRLRPLRPRPPAGDPLSSPPEVDARTCTQPWMPGKGNRSRGTEKTNPSSLSNRHRPRPPRRPHSAGPDARRGVGAAEEPLRPATLRPATSLRDGPGPGRQKILRPRRGRRAPGRARTHGARLPKTTSAIPPSRAGARAAGMARLRTASVRPRPADPLARAARASGRRCPIQLRQLAAGCAGLEPLTFRRDSTAR